jgi:hypothetical protein
LRALFVGLCVLFLTTQALAVARGQSSDTSPGPPRTERAERAVALDTRLERKLAARRKYRSVIRFFDNHRSLLDSAEHRKAAGTALRRARVRLAGVTSTVAALRRALRKREAQQLAYAPPRVAICRVFGPRYCGQALRVAWCESRHSTNARNGQYLGLFQMGSSERRVFGHGATAHRQAVAARRYFLVTGRDWSPWRCKPWYASY